MNISNFSGLPDVRFLGCSPFRSRVHTRKYQLKNCDGLLLVVNQGRMAWQDGEKEYRAETGDVVYHRPDNWYLEWTFPDALTAGVKLHFAWGRTRWPIPAVVHDRTGVIRRLADRILAVYWGAGNDLGRRAPRNTPGMLFQGILAELAELSLEQLPDMQERVRHHVRVNIDRRIPIAELAALFGYHPNYFTRRFTEQVGHSPAEDVRRVRLQAALELVLNTNLPIKAIAAETGFADGPHLSRLFRRYYNTSAQDVRTQISRPNRKAP